MSTTFTVDFFCSLDGYGMATGWPGYLGKEGPEVREDRVRTVAQDQILVFGATTFRQFRKIVVEYDEPYYDSLNELPKIVFSSTLGDPLGWQNSTVLNEDAVTAIERLKRTTDERMRDSPSWSDVKARGRTADPRTRDEQAAGKAADRERREAYVRGHQLVEMRNAAGLTQAELADALGVSQARVSKIEHGEISGIDVVRAYVAVLGGTIDVVARIGDRSWKVA
jgi:DNA-binding XRE family transcriptional regulator